MRQQPHSSGLDAELVWERGEVSEPQAPPRLPVASASRFVVAALADVGALGLSMALAWIVAVLAGASLTPVQIALGATAGALVLAPVALACLWVWRGTPGMLLLAFGAARPLPLARALKVAALWFVTLPLLALPLALRWRGRSLLEHVLKSDLSFHLPHESA